MRDKKKFFELLDCTLRDGGYYNNWNFSKIEIQKYLNAIATTGIKFVELGFRFFESKEIKGLTAYTSKNLLKTLSVPKGLNIGIMINASDLIHNNQPKKEIIKKLVNKKNIHKIKFIRIACHHHEVFLLKDCFQYLKKMKLKIFLNIMQISELNFILFKKILDFLNKNKIKTNLIIINKNPIINNKSYTLNKVVEVNNYKVIVEEIDVSLEDIFILEYKNIFKKNELK